MVHSRYICTDWALLLVGPLWLQLVLWSPSAEPASPVYAVVDNMNIKKWKFTPKNKENLLVFPQKKMLKCIWPLKHPAKPDWTYKLAVM